MSATRPKPWEMSGATATPGSAIATSAPVPAAGLAPTSDAPSAAPPAIPTTGAAESTSALNSSLVPSVPPRPSGLDMDQGLGASQYGNYGGYNSGLGTSYGNNYGSFGSSGYSGYGGMGGYGGYGSYGSYGSGYGSYGMGGMGGYGGYGGYGRYGMGGMGGPMNGPGNALQNSTAATFQLIESIVNAFGGFAQMLESTYMATHSSFFAMMSVAEQFGHLKESLGSILGIFAVLRWGRALIAKLTGRPAPSAAASSLTPASFARFQARGGAAGPVSRPSFKPLVIFLTAVFGLPYLLGKMIRTMANNQSHLGPEGEIVDPSQLEFCRALYDFVPENPQIELEMKRGDLVAVLASTDASGQPSQWWRVRTRDGRSGYVPATYVEIIPRQPQIQALTAPAVATPTQQDDKPKSQ